VPAPDEPLATTDEGLSPATTRSREETTSRPRPPPIPREEAAGEQGQEPAEELGEADQPQAAPSRKRKKARRANAWRLARLGLLVLIIAIGLQLLAGLMGHVVLLLAPRLAMRSLGALNTVLWMSIAFSAVCTLAQAVGFGLCVLAPRESEARPFAVTALACTVLSSFLLNYILWAELRPWAIFSDREVAKYVEEYSRERTGKRKDPKEMEKYVEEQNQRLNDMMKKVTGMTRRMALWRTAQTLIHGVFLVAVPLLLRAFLRALRQKEHEPACDNLLKLGAGIIAAGLLTQLLAGLILTPLGHLMRLVSWVNMLLGLGWQVMFLLLLLQVRQAMPPGRRS
jgi:hypothetical protein